MPPYHPTHPTHPHTHVPQRRHFTFAPLPPHPPTHTRAPEAARILPRFDLTRAMATNPQLVYSFQRGAALIPSDPPRPEGVGGGEGQEGAAAAAGDDDEYSARGWY